MGGVTSFVGRRIRLRFARFPGFLVALLALTAIRDANGGSESSDSPVQFAVLSDLHFNPFLCANNAYTNLAKEPSAVSWVDTFAAYESGQDAVKEKFGQDSSYRLINLALQNLTITHKNLAFILCTGDLFAHEDQIKEALKGDLREFSKNRSNYVVNSEAFVARMMRNAGLTNVFPTIGNNDGAGDYAEPSPTFLKALSESWKFCISQGLLGDDFQDIGCYEAVAPGIRSCRILAFDSTLFSADEVPLRDPGSSKLRAQRAIEWLTKNLDSTNARVYLVYHIPPGSNYYNLTHKGPLTFWEDDFAAQFLDILAKNHAKIIGSFCSHTHNDEFRLVFSHGMPASYIHISPSISPVHGNSPAYQIFTAATNGDILGYETVWLSGFRTHDETWQPEYAFTSFTKDGYNENTLARLFFGRGSRENRRRFSENYYNPGRESSADNTEAYWGTVKLNAPLSDR